MKKYTEIFKTLSDETRLRIINLIMKANSELCVCELTDSLEVPQYNISRHLKILRNAGLIKERKEGRWVYFSVINDNELFMEYLLAAIAQIYDAVLLKDLQELNERFKLRTNGRCKR